MMIIASMQGSFFQNIAHEAEHHHHDDALETSHQTPQVQASLHETHALETCFLCDISLPSELKIRLHAKTSLQETPSFVALNQSQTSLHFFAKNIVLFAPKTDPPLV